MRILVRGQWAAGYLDYHRPENAVRVAVSAMLNLERLTGLYFEPPSSVRLLWNYVRSAGPLEVLRKVRSRRAERDRNEKFVSCGVGSVLEAPAHLAHLLGRPVVFIATAHPACAERLAIDGSLIQEAPVQLGALAEDAPHLLHIADGTEDDAWWNPVGGWTSDSGWTIDPGAAEHLLQRAVRTLSRTDFNLASRLPRRADQRVVTVRPPVRPAHDRKARPAVALVGLGHYAKSVIMPNIQRHLDVRVLQELDPTQVPPGAFPESTVAIAPEVPPDTGVAAVIAAGFHHTHAPIAAAALRAGLYAVSEKPLATTQQQLVELAAALRLSEKYFAGFQRRYLAFNALVRPDLGIGSGDPVSYHCIVYEVPLPPRHWYWWPASGSRLLSNGCHWIDHFLFLNAFASPCSAEVSIGRDGTLNVSVSLENEAVFTMALTDRGSPRIGLRDYVELRAGRATARMTDGGRYEAEGPHSVRRRMRRHRYDGHRRMYRTIARKIAEGAPGDPPLWTVRSTELVLRLEDELRARSSGGRGG